MIGLADRWHCRPSQVLEEDADNLRLLDVYRLGHRDEDDEDEQADEE